MTYQPFYIYFTCAPVALLLLLLLLRMQNSKTITIKTLKRAIKKGYNIIDRCPCRLIPKWKWIVHSLSFSISGSFTLFLVAAARHSTVIVYNENFHFSLLVCFWSPRTTNNSKNRQKYANTSSSLCARFFNDRSLSLSLSRW